MANILHIESQSSINLCYEQNRAETFTANWPHAYISPHILAKIGFYYIGPHDKVKCYFCKTEICSWEMGENEIKTHSIWSPNCPLLNKKDTLNVPIQPTKELQELLSSVAHNLHSSLEIDQRPDAYVETPFSLTSAILPNVDFPAFADEETRLETYENWPIEAKQTPKQLSEAGFLHTQKSDRVICFSCGGGLCDWQPNDDPWEQHAIFYGNCKFLLRTKGIKYINEVKEKYKSNTKKE